MNTPLTTHKARPAVKKYWTERKTISKILDCSCGGKYIKTRPNQVVCVSCMVKSGEIK